mmetsp:Transcript_29152/g.59246  ORF Transcript_29152/g.59246 Transcript_29152/m.59246 type:complete len:229 (-) Transcript_29152:68-754(-)
MDISSEGKSTLIGKRAWVVDPGDHGTSNGTFGTISKYFPNEPLPRWEVELESGRSLRLTAEEAVRATKAYDEEQKPATIQSAEERKIKRACLTSDEANVWRQSGHPFIGETVKVWKVDFERYYSGRVVAWLPQGKEESDYEMWKVFLPDYDELLGFEDYGGPEISEDGERDPQSRAVLEEAIVRGRREVDPEFKEIKALKASDPARYSARKKEWVSKLTSQLKQASNA